MHGNKGRKLSEEHKLKLKTVAKAHNFGKWMLGKKLSEEHVMHMRAGLKIAAIEGRMSPWLGKKLTETHKKHIGLGNLIAYTEGRHVLGMKDKHHSSMAREKIREYQIENPNKKFSNTIIEQKVAAELERRGFIRDEDFFQNFGIRGIKNVDFYLPKLNVVIECDGCFYHACHQCGFTKYHQDMIESDIQNTVLLEMSGYRLYRFWEHDINESIEKSINKII